MELELAKKLLAEKNLKYYSRLFILYHNLN